MKKFMSLLLTFAMVFACLPIQGGATEEDTQYTEATIDFSDVANRTVYSTTQQVWEQNGITVTNNKGSSTTNVGDYYNPAKFYKNSQLIVACNDMIQIAFAANTTGYASDLDSAITAAGLTSSVSGKIVTVAFDEPVDSFEVTLSTAKVFVDSITVTVPATSEPRATISFDLNYDGATGAPGNATIIVGGTYGTLPQVSREGYTFDGWFFDSECTGTAVEATDTVTEDHILYAKWTAKPVATVSFDPNDEGITDAPEDVTVIVGSTYEALPTVSRDGYIFGGWFADIGCTGTAVKATDVVNESHTLYAKWTAAAESEISEITIDFSTTDQRTSYSTEQQVWTNAALTFTNDKDTSTTDVGDYSNPVRLYKNSSVTIACAGMTQIVIVSDGSSSYKNALTASFDTAGATYTTSDDTYTIIFAEPADTFTVSLSAGQARFESITVIAFTSGGETPDPMPEETEPTPIDHFTYTTDGTNLTITGYTGTDTELVISSTYTIDGTEYTVTAIGSSAFYGCDSLISATIPDSVTSIGAGAFSSCTGLRDVTIGNGVTSICDSAFYNCTGLSGITIPDSVTSIGYWAFTGCSSLTSITIPDSVTSIGGHAFNGCSGLTYNTYDNGKYLGNESNPYLYLAGVTSETITSVTIHADTKFIGDGAFNGCSGLVEITIPGSVIGIGERAFSGCSGLTEITIPDSVTSIGYWAFYNCTGLTEITIPESVTKIGNCLLNGCTGLITLNFNAINYSIYGYMPEPLVKDCTNLTTVNFGDNVTKIPGDAFSGCSSLTSVTIPDSVTSIGSGAFYGCTGLTTVYYTGTEEQRTSMSISSYNDPLLNAKWVYGLPIPDYFDYTLDGTELTITGYTGTETELVINSTYAIDGTECTVTAIDGAFYGCTKLTSVTIPATVNGISDNAFSECTSLTGIWVDPNNTAFCSDSFGVLFNKAQTELLCAPGGFAGGYTIPDSVTSIGFCAFDGCTGLTDITFGNSVTEIKYCAFAGCTGLSSIELPDGLTTIGEGAFVRCSGLTNIRIPDSVVSIAASQTSIASGVFIGCESLTYNVYDNAKYLGNENNPYAALVAVTAKDITSCKINDRTKVICGGAFADCIALTSIEIPEGVNGIDSGAFYGCSNLESITIPFVGDTRKTSTDPIQYQFGYIFSIFSYEGGVRVEQSTLFPGYYIPATLRSVTVIGGEILPGAFKNCSMLTSVVMKSGVTTISTSAFDNCAGLTSVTISNSVTSIGESAFYGCAGLTDVYYTGTEEQKAEMSIGDSNDPLVNATWLFSQIEESTSTIVNSWGITLNDEVVVKFNMTFTSEILADENAYVEVKVGNSTTNVPVSEVTGPIQVPVMASQMTEKITLCIVDGNGVSSEADSFTVRQYCDTILGNEAYAEYHELVKEMLNYGSAAQLYFGNNTEDLAGEGINDAGQQSVPTEGGEYSLEDQIEGLDCYGATLVHRDKIGLRYYFTGDLTGCTFAVNGIAAELQVGEGNYVEVADILPQNLDKEVILTVTDAQGNTINVTYCPMNYIIRMNQKGESATKALVKALYNYYLAAKAYSAKAA